jgi:hypothetical protein
MSTTEATTVQSDGAPDTDDDTCLCEIHDGDLGCFEHYEVDE